MKKIPLKKLPTNRIKEMKDSGLGDEEIVKSLRPDFSNQEIDDAFNQNLQKEDNILDQLDQFEPNKEMEREAPEDLLEKAPAPNQSEKSFSGYMPSEDRVYSQPQFQGLNSDQIQEVVESIVEEKWEDLISKVGDINLWKENVNNDIESIKQEVLRVQERFNNLQNILIGKVTDYNKSVIEINSEMKALEQVMQKIIEPLTRNIKELNKITSQLKSKKSI